MATDIVKKLEEEIKKIDDKKFKVMFFVWDTKGAPNGSIAYIYETALTLKNKGYNVQMLYADEEFVGVESWLGEEYSTLPHFSIAKDNITASPSDILLIPEVCTSIMSHTKDLPCKRVAIIQNYAYLTDTMPMGVGMDDMRIGECITTNEKLAKELNKSFPRMKTNIVRPSIPDYFFDTENKPKKLVVNVVAKNSYDVNSIMKPFYWKYPMYQWVAFKEVKNLPRTEFAKTLRDGFATIWADPYSDFGYSALEAMACGNIVIGKVPETAPQWMTDADGNMLNNGIWYFDNRDAQDIIAGVIQSFITNAVPSEIYQKMKQTTELYKKDGQNADIEEIYVKGIFENRKKELQIAIEVAKNNNEEKPEN